MHCAIKVATLTGLQKIVEGIRKRLENVKRWDLTPMFYFGVSWMDGESAWEKWLQIVRIGDEHAKYLFYNRKF